MAMTNTNCGYSTSEINKFSPCIIVEILTVSSHCEEGLLVVGLVEGEHVLLVEFPDFLLRHAGVGFGLEG